ncbi:MAG: phenylalanine--tRNA ligase subunit alpha, partial [Acidobacteria bacterium]
MARKNGVLTQINDLWLRAAPKDGKRDVGQRVNALKTTVEEYVQKSRPSVSATAMPRGVSAKAEVGVVKAYGERPIDITLPGIRRPLGAEHPIIKTMNEMVSVFRNLGYSIEEGPEIETDYYNFESLNFPPNHPARD